MSERPRYCVVIPTYDNAATIGSVVDQVRPYLSDIIVVDDGSGPELKAALKQLDDVDIVHRAANGGKGAAVKSGLRRAHELGFTHALQVDADGQHNLQDIPKMLEASREQPRALILGRPVFDESAPKARLWGRKISVFWVRLETIFCEATIEDPLCGFRVYPVDKALAANARGDRMDFDPEIAVRMVWLNVPVRNIATSVRYVSEEEGGVSHFRAFRDNVLISLLHARLCIVRMMGLWRWL